MSAPRELSDSLRVVALTADRLLSPSFPYATVVLGDDDRVVFSASYRDRATARRVVTRKTTTETRGFVAVHARDCVAVFSGDWHLLGTQSV